MYHLFFWIWIWIWIFYSSLDPRPGTTARTAPIIEILETLGRYHYRYNFRPRVVIPFNKAQGIGTPHRYPCTGTTTSVLLSAR
jgi:hypothetical protein